jgi:gas vesicle protein
MMGGVVASSLVLLLTPYSGDNLRAKISELANQTYKDIRQAGEQRRDELQLELQELRAPK